MLRLIHEGDVILEIGRQCLSATLRTARGSGPPTFLSDDDGVIELVIEKVPTGGPVRLDQLEAAQVQAIRDRATEGETVGLTDNALSGEDARVMATRQGVHTDTLGEGRGRNEDPPLGGFPVKDLAADLDPSDVEGRTAAIEKFNSGRSDDKDRDTDAVAETAPASSQDDAGTSTDSDQSQKNVEGSSGKKPLVDASVGTGNTPGNTLAEGDQTGKADKGIRL